MKYKKFCLVLGGGGTKGSYEIGVWKALRELGIPLESVIGTSIGAINALLVAQDDYERAEEIWNGLTMDQVLRLPENFDPGPQDPGAGDMATFSLLGKILLEKGELDNSPLQNLIEGTIDFTKLAKNKIDLGIVTFNITKMRGEEIFLWDLLPDQLADYIRASAAFPGFTKNKVGRHTYIDGGVFDNIPYRTARRRGYKHIIVVDVSGLGNNRSLSTEGTETILIKNSMKMGHVLDFRPGFIQDFKRLGYLDTLKVFDRCEGAWYFLKKEQSIWRRWNAILEQEDFFATLKTILPIALQNLPPLTALRQILPKEFTLTLNPAQILLECAASALNIPRIQLLTPRGLLERVLLEYNSLMKKVRSMDLSGYKNLFTGITEEIRDPKLARMLQQNAPLEIDLLMARLGFASKHPKLNAWFNGAFPQVLPAKVFFFLFVYYRRNFDRIPFLPRHKLSFLPIHPLHKNDDRPV